MSYGKDQSHLAKIPTYGGSYAQKAGNASRKRQVKPDSGGNRPFWVDTFKPLEMTPIWCRLLPVECTITRADDNANLYQEVIPWFEYREHFHGRYKRSAICSAGPLHFLKARRDPCIGCDIFWSTPKAGKGERKIISRSEKYVFAVVDMSNYHKVPQVDDTTGQYRMNPETNQPYLQWVRCAGYGCSACHTAYETRPGHIMPWAMSKAHFNALNAYADGIGTCCISCGGRGTISAIAYNCAGCSTNVVDMRNTTANANQIRELATQHYHCRACNTVDYPVEVLHCKQCQSPRRATLFDVDINVMVTRTGDGDATALILQNTTDPKPLDPQFQDLLQYTPDLMKRFAPTPLDIQADLFQVNTQAQTQQPQQPPQPVAYAQQYSPSHMAAMRPTAPQEPVVFQPQMQHVPAQQPPWQPPPAPAHPIQAQPWQQPVQQPQQPHQQPNQAPVPGYPIPPHQR